MRRRRMAKLIDGKKLSEEILSSVAVDVKKLNEKGISVSLAVIIVGDNPASRTYVNNKKRACEKVGILSHEFALPEDTTQQELMRLIDELNARSDINGILCQLPLPKHLDEEPVIETILTQKDVDAFHPSNVGHIMIGDFKFLACTPAGIMEMLKSEGIDVCGKHCVVVGRSNIVGKPMAMLLLKANGTVTICHSKTKNLQEITKQADILVVAVGKPKMIKGNMVKQGAVVIDAGINRDENNRLCGDVDFAQVEPKASKITPVPGGVGPTTIAMLLRNTVTAAIIQNNL
jgi:methylenetetrahydrofolate dehydrogenase (NADP+)/methenyltetrahydrofolate cyclohydrolase